MASHPEVDALRLLAGAARALKDRVADVDRLNVFPVPDGDTGTNMSLTMDSVMAEVEALPPDPGRHAACKAVAHGSLMGARGNSGVILSQVLRGLCDVLGAAETVTPSVVASALERSAAVSYQAVRKPVEGTMLTVVKDAARAAVAAEKAGVDIDTLLQQVVSAAYDSVRRSPDLLPVLRENNVVDAGGLGLAILAEGFVAALEGLDVRLADVVTAESETPTIVPADDWDDQEYLYCTEFSLHGHDLDRSSVQEWVIALGGSELVVGDSSMLKIHVHTDVPAEVLAKATALGEIEQVHINNMRRQTAERTDALRRETPQAPQKDVAVVAVAAGKGLAGILQSLGVDVVVNGGQTMNPSTKELLEACRRVDAASYIILPNNRNILLTAQQVPAVFDRQVAVVPTTSVPQAFSAMLAFDAEAQLADNAVAMEEAAGAVRTGEVTVAVKDSSGRAGQVRAGQVIGIRDHEVEVIGDDVTSVALELAEMLAEDAETATLLAGEDFTDEDASQVARLLAERHPEIEIETVRGDQPVYHLLMAFE